MHSRRGREIVATGQLNCLPRGRLRVCDDDDVPYTCSTRALDDLFPIVIEARVTQMAVRVNQHFGPAVTSGYDRRTRTADRLGTTNVLTRPATLDGEE